MKNLFKLIFFVSFFTVLIFVVNNLLIPNNKGRIEEQFVDRTKFDLNLSLEASKEFTGSVLEETRIITKINEETNKRVKIDYTFYYIPDTFEIASIEQRQDLENIILSQNFNTFVKSLGIELNEEKGEVRGKMQSRRVKLFGVLLMKKPELVSVFVHEFAHYIDIYHYSKGITGFDMSDDFYAISWEATKITKPNSKSGDFVSGYAMSNKYEDFAESFTYYVLHNGDFLAKANQNPILMEKYNYFKNNIFMKGEFQDNDFGYGLEIKDYYRDITKIEINLENFLQYLEI